MPRHWQVFWAGLSTAAMVLWMVSAAGAAFPRVAKEPGVPSQDPFDAAEKAAGPPIKDTSAGAVKPAEKGVDKKVARKEEPEYVRKSLQEWQRSLPRGVYEVTRLKATEQPFSGRYATGHFHGTFLCACCNAELFSSDTKFDSGTGWPSFWQPIKARAIDRAIDNSESEPRIEVMCHRCGAHLGHVFEDAPATPTGLRFCINSLALKLKSTEAAGPASTNPKVKTTRSRAKTAPRSTRVRGATRPGSPGPGDEEPEGAEPPAAGKPDGKRP